MGTSVAFHVVLIASASEVVEDGIPTSSVASLSAPSKNANAETARLELAEMWRTQREMRAAFQEAAAQRDATRDKEWQIWYQAPTDDNAKLGTDFSDFKKALQRRATRLAAIHAELAERAQNEAAKSAQRRAAEFGPDEVSAGTETTNHGFDAVVEN